MTVQAPAPLAYIEALCSAMLRAQTGNALLQWSGQTLYHGTDTVALHAPHHSHVLPTLHDRRALSDSAGLRLAYSNAQLHAQHAPAEPVDRLIYELLEQLRTESLAPQAWPGVRSNLAQRFVRWAQAFIDSGLPETTLGILLLTVSLAAWSRLTGNEVPELMADLVEGTRVNIAPDIGRDLSALRQHRDNQAQFIPHALALSRWVGQAVKTAQDQDPAGTARSHRRNGFALNLHFESADDDAMPKAASGVSRSWEALGQRYRIFSTAYDRVVDASSLVRTAQLAEFRAQMDQEVQDAKINVARLARWFHQALTVPRRDGWRFQQEEGVIDGSRLAQLVSEPQDTAIFKHEMLRPKMDCAVSFLLDCSGSMKTHAAATSLLVDVLGRALDQAGVVVEVLGFSTGAWNGGRMRKEWVRAGQPQYPGRLNETLHMVFKSGTQNWRRGRHGIAALRKPDLFREGVDGEAVQWACQRLLQLPAQRRILVVISDGCPMDTATHQCNDAHYLDQHLKQVVAAHERTRDVDIRGLGVGLDLGLFYRRRLALDLREGLDDNVFRNLAQWLIKP